MKNIELIEKKKLIETLIPVLECYCGTEAGNAIYATVKECPPAREIVECQNCIYLAGGSIWTDGYYCGRTAKPGDRDHVALTDFCSKGIKKR